MQCASSRSESRRFCAAQAHSQSNSENKTGCDSIDDGMKFTPHYSPSKILTVAIAIPC